MARKGEEKIQDFTLDEEEVNRVERTPIIFPQDEEMIQVRKSNEQTTLPKNLINCLSNEKVIVEFIEKPRGMYTDPKNPFYGAMGPTAEVSLPVPMLRSGGFVDVLTKAEKDYLEYIMNLEPNALSVHNRENNFWSDANPKGIGRVTLKKGKTVFDMSKPVDYIKLKIVMAHKDLVAPSMQDLRDKPKATYRFVIIRDQEEAKANSLKVNNKQEAYMLFGEVRKDKDKLRVIIETLDGRPTAANSSLEFLQGKVGELLEQNVKLFLNAVKDPYLDTKVLIKKAVEAGIILNRGGFLYIKEGSTITPLCENGEEPLINIACKYLNHPKHQELKFSIEAKLDNK